MDNKIHLPFCFAITTIVHLNFPLPLIFKQSSQILLCLENKRSTYRNLKGCKYAVHDPWYNPKGWTTWNDRKKLISRLKSLFENVLESRREPLKTPLIQPLIKMSSRTHAKSVYFLLDLSFCCPNIVLKFFFLFSFLGRLSCLKYRVVFQINVDKNRLSGTEEQIIFWITFLDAESFFLLQFSKVTHSIWVISNLITEKVFDSSFWQHVRCLRSKIQDPFCIWVRSEASHRACVSTIYSNRLLKWQRAIKISCW